jgi:serine/threonine-protein kinase
VTSDFSAHLQQILGSDYTIERELGGGGMSRVFVAQDTALGRRVVVKVLPPEMSAAINAERFRREIQLAAQLQHPHIVPLLSAGKGGKADSETLYYTMPFVEGENLRGLLARKRELSIVEAIRLLREVADALAYAHDRGVVHRDIKPENILLTTGHALVADFGIARALTAAAAAGSSLTSVGMAVGTPAYMAPEQAAADPLMDHRADLYALGVVAYEVLVGHPPFHDLAPQQLIVAHAATRPRPLQEHRAAVPPILATLVMRLLEKRPADRPQTAAEVVKTLDAAMSESHTAATVGTYAPARPTPARRAAMVVVAIAGVALAVAAIAKIMPSRATETLDANLIAVAPFRVSGDASLQYLREGMLDLLAAKLTGEGGPRVGDPRTLLAAWNQRAGSSAQDLPQSDAIEVAKKLGAGKLLLGSVVATPSRIALHATLIDVQSDAHTTNADAEGVPDSLDALVDRLAADLLARSAVQIGRLQNAPNTPLPLLRLYLEGMANYRRGRYADAQAALGQALAMDSTFVPAALGRVLIQGYHPIDDSLAWAVVNRAHARLSARDRALIEHRRRFVTGESYVRVIEASYDATVIAPDRVETWTNLGDWVGSFGSLTDMTDFRERGRAAYRRAMQLDPEFAVPVGFDLRLAAEQGDTASVRELWTKYERLGSGAIEFEYTRWRVAHALGDSAAIASIRGRVMTLPPRDLLRMLEYMMVDNIGLADAEPVIRALETRAVEEYDVTRGGLAMNSYYRNAGRDERQPPRFGGPPGDEFDQLVEALYWDGDTTRVSGALAALTRIAGDRAEGGFERLAASCLVTHWYLTRGDTLRASPFLARTRAQRATLQPDDDLVIGDACLMSANAMTAQLRDDRTSTALAQLDSLLKLGNEGTQFATLISARLHEQRGDLRAALVSVRRRANHGRDGPRMLSTLLREEGRLAALTGDVNGAIKAYRHFLALRPNPVERLRADTERIRSELQRLEAGRGRQ